MGFQVKGALGSTSNGINPVTEPVTLQVSTFATTIPAGSFTKSPFGTYTFIGVIDGVSFGAVVQPTGSKPFLFRGGRGGGIECQRDREPVTVRLSMGDNSGKTSVNAVIF
jgi:hypothetical protein